MHIIVAASADYVTAFARLAIITPYIEINYKKVASLAYESDFGTVDLEAKLADWRFAVA